MGSLAARELHVDSRGGAEFKSLYGAASIAQAGDSIIIAPGSGPYRETLSIKASGTADAPITVEGNGATITGFDPLNFEQKGETWVARLPMPYPVVIAQNGVRILETPDERLIGPIRVLSDNRTVELLPGTSPEGWEASKRDCPIRIVDASYHTYRNLTVSGGFNDGVNLHGDGGEGLYFENIVACNNLDEGLSAHKNHQVEMVNCKIWGNDNGISNANHTLTTLKNVDVYDNLGWGIWFHQDAVVDMQNVRAWNNGMAQLFIDNNASGKLENVYVWEPAWPTRQWRSYKESSQSKAPASAFRGKASELSPTLWTGDVSVGAGEPPVSDPALLVPGIGPPEGFSANEPVDEGKPINTEIAKMIKDAVRSNAKTLKLPEGTFYLDQTIIISGAKNLEIDGAGTTLIMTTRNRSIFYLTGNADLMIRGLTLDYNPLPFTQGTITNVASDSFEFTIHQGYPELAPEYNHAALHLFTPERVRHPDAYDFYKAKIEITGQGKGKATRGDGWPDTLQAGDMVVLDRRNIDATNTVEIRESKGAVLFQDITVYSAPALSFAGRYNEAVVGFKNVVVKPGPTPEGATEPRIFSSNADVFNFVQNRVGPFIDSCDISGQGDDTMNVHGMFMPIARVISRTEFLTVFPHGPSGLVNPYRKGDELRIYEPEDFSIIGTASFGKIETLKTVGDITADEVKVYYPIGFDGRRYTVYKVQLAAPANLVQGQWFDCPAVNSGNFVVRNTYMHDHRGRGLRVMGCNGLIENNRFERITKCAISVGPELAFWREAGWVDDLTIRGNTIRDIGVDYSLAATSSYAPGAISIFVHDADSKPPYISGNKNILIEDNVIENCSVAGIHAYGVSDLIIRGNTLSNTNQVRYVGHVDPVTHLETTGPISIDDAVNVTLENNKF